MPAKGERTLSSSSRGKRDRWDIETIAEGEWGEEEEDEEGARRRVDGEGREEEGHRECGTHFRHSFLQVSLCLCERDRGQGRGGEGGREGQSEKADERQRVRDLSPRSFSGGQSTYMHVLLVNIYVNVWVVKACLLLHTYALVK